MEPSASLGLMRQPLMAAVWPATPATASPQMEARAVVALMVGRFRLSVPPRMGDRQAVRDAEVMKLTL